MKGDTNSATSMEVDNESQNQTMSFLGHRVYLAAKDGLAMALCTLLSSIDSDMANTLVNKDFFSQEGEVFSPLSVAARYGHDAVVMMLLANFKPNIEQECSVKFEGNIVEGATALWVAAESGHLNIVKLLVHHGADVNHGTKTKSTPLRAACFDGRLDIVMYLVAHGADINLPNMYNNTCLMIASYKGHKEIVSFLLENGARVNEQALCGATALHYAAESGNEEVCKNLLAYNAELLKNEYGMTAVITAADRACESVVLMFINTPDLLSRTEKIDAYELLGATFANDKDNYHVVKALMYLKLGMQLRYEDSNNIIRKGYRSPIPAYENWIESQTMAELSALQYNNNSIHMESLTIRERILGTKCPEVIHPIIFRGAICADNLRFDRCESLWLHALELRKSIDLSIERDLLRFSQLFSQMLQLDQELRLSSLLQVLNSCALEIERVRRKINDPGPKDDIPTLEEELQLNTLTALYLCTLVTKIVNHRKTVIIDETLNGIYQIINRLIKMNVQTRDGQTLLHLAVNGITPVDDFHINDVCRFPCVDTVQLLLKCGANVLIVDGNRNSPLHTLTHTMFLRNHLDLPSSIDLINKMMKIFINYGAHLDAVNDEGYTPAQLCGSPLIAGIMHIYETRHMCLQCLASRTIGQYKLKYENYVPKHLESFIAMHIAEKLNLS